MCDDSIIDDGGMEAIGRRILERLDPLACLPSAPPEGSRCAVTLRPLDPASPCPEGTSLVEAGSCSLTEEQWSLVDSGECTELRPSPTLTVPPGAALEIRCE